MVSYHHRSLLSAACCFCIFLRMTSAQNFSIPSSWQNTTAIVSQSKLATLIDPITQNVTSFMEIESITGYAPYYSFLLTELSANDLLTGNTHFRSSVLDQVNRTLHEILDDSLEFMSAQFPAYLECGIAAVQAYLSYNDSNALTLAEELWNTVSTQIQFAITCSSEYSIGSPPAELTTSPSDPDRSLDIDIGIIGGFIRFSAHLYNVTSNQTYGDGAQSALQFLQRIVPSSGDPIQISLLTDVQLDCLSETSYSTTTDNLLQPYYWGQILEGTSIMAARNTSLTPYFRALLYQLIYGGWTDSIVGVFTYDNNSTEISSYPTLAYTSHFIRGLSQAWTQLDIDDAAAILIKSYINVQVNSLLNAASVPDKLWYGNMWQGPRPTVFTPNAEWAALSLFNAAYQITGPNGWVTSSSQPPGATQAPPPNANYPSPHSATGNVRIIGPIVGSLLGTCVLIASAACCIRRRRNKPSWTRSLVNYAQVDIMNAMSLRKGLSEPAIGREKGQMVVDTISPIVPEVPQVSHPPAYMSAPELQETQAQPRETASISEGPRRDSLVPQAIISRINHLLARLPPDFGANENANEPPPSYVTNTDTGR